MAKSYCTVQQIQLNQLQNMTWDEFYRTLKSYYWNFYLTRHDDDRFARVTPSFLYERLELLSTAKDYFENELIFENMPQPQRRLIAGLQGNTNEAVWELFGNMSGAGTFNGVMNNNPVGSLQHISNALSHIPLSGNVTVQNYNDYLDNLLQAFPNGGAATATITRLLAMKRPDYFLCITAGNVVSTNQIFGGNITPDNYWHNIVEQIQGMIWWQSVKPTNYQKTVWEGRAALLDSLMSGAAPHAFA